MIWLLKSVKAQLCHGFYMSYMCQRSREKILGYFLSRWGQFSTVFPFLHLLGRISHSPIHTLLYNGACSIFHGSNTDQKHIYRPSLENNSNVIEKLCFFFFFMKTKSKTTFRIQLHDIHPESNCSTLSRAEMVACAQLPRYQHQLSLLVLLSGRRNVIKKTVHLLKPLQLSLSKRKGLCLVSSLSMTTSKY